MSSRFRGWPPDKVEEALATLGEIRDTVLDNAQLRDGETVLDVGAGTGLLTFGALERVGETGEVIALDVSPDCLDELRLLARDQAINGRLSLLLGDATVLPLPDESVDAVLTRSVLIYVRDKAEAAREFFRVLHPGGRFSLFEPINRHNTRVYEAIDFSPLGELGERVAADEEACYASDDPMVDFDENDLARFFAETGFVEIESELARRDDTWPSERWLRQQGAPGAPTLLESWQRAFAPEEVERLVAFLEGKSLTFRWTRLYLAGRKLR